MTYSPTGTSDCNCILHQDISHMELYAGQNHPIWSCMPHQVISHAAVHNTKPSHMQLSGSQPRLPTGVQAIGGRTTPRPTKRAGALASSRDAIPGASAKPTSSRGHKERVTENSGDATTTRPTKPPSARSGHNGVSEAKASGLPSHGRSF
jgi:hypothetical protein